MIGANPRSDFELPVPAKSPSVTHRAFPMRCFLRFLPVCFLAVARPLETCAADNLPNVVLILADDLGWADIGCLGSTFNETPNLDALAKRGALFTDAYAASPVCSPTRASILSGKYPSRIGMSYLAGVSGPSGKSCKLVPPPVAGNIPPEDTTLAEALKEHGYTTAHIGKWHLQSHSEKGNANFPDKHGFEVNIAGTKTGQPGSYHFPYKSSAHPETDVPDMADGRDGDFLTDALTTKAISFIKENRERPFFLNLWYFAVHTPIEAREDKLAKYTAKAKSPPFAQAPGEAVPEHQSFTNPQQRNPAYAALLESLDDNVGRIMAALKDLGIDDNTIVIFTSDNGGLSTGPHGRMPTSNLPLRAGKGWLYEGGIRVPLIIDYPGKIAEGLRIAEPVVSTDIYPTILGLAGLPPLPNQHIDGVSLVPLLEGNKPSLGREAVYFHFPHYHHINTMGPSGAVRAGDYKLIEVFETGKKELYNLRDDIGETRDLSSDRPELAAKLSAMLDQWRQSSGSAMTTPNPDFEK